MMLVASRGAAVRCHPAVDSVELTHGPQGTCRAVKWRPPTPFTPHPPPLAAGAAMRSGVMDTGVEKMLFQDGQRLTKTIVTPGYTVEFVKASILLW